MPKPRAKNFTSWLHLQFQITSLISDGITPSPIHHVIPAPEYDGSIVPQTNNKGKVTGKNGLWFLDLILPSCLFQFLILSIFFDIVGLGYRIETLPWHIGCPLYHRSKQRKLSAKIRSCVTLSCHLSAFMPGLFILFLLLLVIWLACNHGWPLR